MNPFGIFITAMLAAALVLLVVARLAVERIERNHYAQRADFYAAHPVPPGSIVFLGDSITDGAAWEELFPNLPTRNRGINGDTVSGVYERLDSIVSGRPTTVFILIGTNDLPFFEYHDDEHILFYYRKILERFYQESPQTRVWVQSILPRHPRHTRRILGLNAALKRIAPEYGAGFINLFPLFVGEDGGLRRELTNDRLHLMASGYTLWVERIAPEVHAAVSRA